MDLLWELLITIALSLLLPLVFLLVTPNFEAHEKVPVIGHDRDHEVNSDCKSWGTDEIVRIAGKINELGDKPIPGKLIVPVQDIVEVSRGSPKICNSEKVDENTVHNEIELFDFDEDRVVEEGNEGIVNTKEVVVELSECDSREHKVEEVEILQCERNCKEIDIYSWNEEIDETKDLVVDEDDWEGIERTELEKRFGAAVVFVGSKSNADLSDDVKMMLHGYHQIATQGPCHEPRPMALKFSARAKWIAWRKLGIMSPEQAMEQYIRLLSESVPDWTSENPNDNAKRASAEIMHLQY